MNDGPGPPPAVLIDPVPIPSDPPLDPPRTPRLYAHTSLYALTPPLLSPPPTPYHSYLPSGRSVTLYVSMSSTPRYLMIPEKREDIGVVGVVGVSTGSHMEGI